MTLIIILFLASVLLIALSGYGQAKQWDGAALFISIMIGMLFFLVCAVSFNEYEQERRDKSIIFAGTGIVAETIVRSTMNADVISFEFKDSSGTRYSYWPLLGTLLREDTDWTNITERKAP